MRTALIFPTAYYLFTQPIDGVSLLLGTIFIILVTKFLLKHINERRFNRIVRENIPEEVINFYVNKR